MGGVIRDSLIDQEINRTILTTFNGDRDAMPLKNLSSAPHATIRIFPGNRTQKPASGPNHARFQIRPGDPAYSRRTPEGI